LNNAKTPRLIDDGRLYAPAALRNRASLIDLLRGVLPDQGRVLEIASGTGEHAVAFAAAFPLLTFQPSEPNATCLASIRAWIKVSGVTNVAAPFALDVTELPWAVAQVDAVLCINLLHLAAAPLEAVLRGAAMVLKPGGMLVTYGPFTPELVQAMAKSASEHDLIPLPRHPMPDQHLALLFRRGA